MARNLYEVSSTLVVDATESVLAPNLTVSDLNVGQIGVFSHKDNISIGVTGSFASETLTLSANLTDGDTILVTLKDGTVLTYTALDTFVDANYNFHIQGTASGTLDAFISEVTGVATGGLVAGTDFSTSPAVPTDFTVAAGAGDTVVATALVVGQAGNFIGVGDTSATASWGSAYLNGGTLNPMNSGEFFMAVGIGDCDGNLVDAKKSAGFKIQPKNLDYYTFRCYTPYQPEVWEITDFSSIACETEYQIKALFRNKQSLFDRAARPVPKTYSVVTSCCEGCGCPSGDCIDLAVKLAKDLASDGDGCFTVALFPNSDKTAVLANGEPDPDATITTGNEIDPTDDVAIAAYKVSNPTPDADSCLSIRLYPLADACVAYCGIPFTGAINNYNDLPHSLLMVEIAGILGFECVGNFTRVRNTIMSEVTSNSRKLKDFFEAGWEGTAAGVYRQTRSGVTLPGAGIGANTTNCNPCCAPGYHSLIIGGTNYNMEGWRASNNQPTATEVLIPACADGLTTGITPVTGFEFVEILDAITGQSLYDEAVSCPACETANTTSTAFGNQTSGSTPSDGQSNL